LEITATVTQANNDWPHVIVCINETEIYNDKQDRIHIKYSGSVDDPYLNLTVELLNKTTNHTVVDSNGNILENQHVLLESIIVNGVDLVRTRLIHRVGDYRMHLDEIKKQHFKNLGIDIGPTTSLSMYENGVWKIQLQQPVLSYLSALQAKIEPWEQGNWQYLSEEIYKTIEICKQLEGRRL